MSHFVFLFLLMSTFPKILCIKAMPAQLKLKRFLIERMRRCELKTLNKFILQGSNPAAQADVLKSTGFMVGIGIYLQDRLV